MKEQLIEMLKNRENLINKVGILSQNILKAEINLLKEIISIIQ